MKSRLAAVFVMAFAGAPGSVAHSAQDRPAQSAEHQVDFTLARHRAGRLKIGMRVEEVVRLFGQQRIKPVDLMLEGMPTPALEIRPANSETARPSLTAELGGDNDSKIFRVWVYDRRFRTADGLGVGSTLGEIRARRQVKVSDSEGQVVAVADDLEMAFHFGSPSYPSGHPPASAQVQFVLLLPFF